MSRMFGFDPKAYAPRYDSHGFVHVRGGQTPEFHRKLSAQVQRFLEANRLGEWHIGEKEQALYAFPEDADYFSELLDTVAAVCGLDRSTLVLSERHIKAYEPEAGSRPLAHKDRYASQVAVGLSVSVPAESKLVLYPSDETWENPYSSSAELRGGIAAESLPESRLGKVPPVEVKDSDGDVVMFRGNSFWHTRLNPAGTTMLYLKLNDFGCDPLKEDPRAGQWRSRNEAALRLSDEQLAACRCVLGRAVDHVQRRYTRDWREVPGVVFWGSGPQEIDEREFRVLQACGRGRSVREVLETAGAPSGQDGLRLIRRLAGLGMVDLSPAA
jgi:hypothetical protein